MTDSPPRCSRTIVGASLTRAALQDAGLTVHVDRYTARCALPRGHQQPHEVPTPNGPYLFR